MATYTKGGQTYTPTDHNFYSTYDAIRPDVERLLVSRYGKELLNLSYLFQMFGAEKGATDIQYDHWEEDRIYPKIKATTSGASAGASATFTLDSSSTTAIGSASPYDTSVTGTKNGNSVVKGDVIQIKPASGTTASSGNYIQAIVTSVNKSAGTFVAYPVNSAKSIPSIATADEISIVGQATGEGEAFPEGYSFKATKYSNYMGTTTMKHTVSYIGNDVVLWYEPDGAERGAPKFTIKGEQQAYGVFCNKIDLGLLVGESISNTTLAQVFHTAETPILRSNGLIPEMISRANIQNYTGATGLTVSDIEDMVITLNAEKAGDEHMMFNGIRLDGQIDREFRDILKNGAISYGTFSADQEKSANLRFQEFTVNGHRFLKRRLEAFNDVQSLGASGYGYPYEGFCIPTKQAKVAGGEEFGSMVPTLRLRYLQSAKGEDNRKRVVFHDKMKEGDDAKAVYEIRYYSVMGFELMAPNTCLYIKRS